MRKTVITIFAALAALVSCEEWEPVYTLKYDEPADYERVSMTPTMTIAQLASKYKIGKPVSFTEDVIIGGTVSSSDQSGNIYKSLYIQDETGGIELKLGKTSLYNDYKEGQKVYVNMNGLTIGMYGYKAGKYGGNGIVQIGLEDPTNEYETSYIEVSSIIDAHVFKGEIGSKVTPVVLTESQLPKANSTIATCPYIGALVTLKGLRYANEIFTLVYIDSNLDKKASSNRVFLSDQTFGVNTWALSKSRFIEHLDKGSFDSVMIGNSGDYNYGTVLDHKAEIRSGAQPATVSQYFKMGSTEVAIRTSGYSRFCDVAIDPAVLSGEKSIDATGILTLYQGSIQLTLLSLDDVTVNQQ